MTSSAGIRPTIQPEPWQTCTSVSKNSWGYISHHVYKEAAPIIHHLIDIVSKNGCLLLNVGPKPDGTIPDEEQALLREIGRWLQVNGEAIYGSRPWRIPGEGPTEVVDGQFNDNDLTFTAQDIRFTTRDERLFAITLGEPHDAVVIKSLAAERIRTVRLLGYEPALTWTQDETGLRIQIPQSDAGKHAWVFEICLA